MALWNKKLLLCDKSEQRWKKLHEILNLYISNVVVILNALYLYFFVCLCIIMYLSYIRPVYWLSLKGELQPPVCEAQPPAGEAQRPTEGIYTHTETHTVGHTLTGVQFAAVTHCELTEPSQRLSFFHTTREEADRGNLVYRLCGFV